MAVHVAFEKGWDFGKSIVWPFGPLGFLYSRTFHPSDYSICLLGSSLLSLAFLVGICSWSRKYASSTPGQFLLVLIPILLATLALDTLFFLLVFLAFHLPLENSDERHPHSVLFAAALGLSALVKFTFFMLSGLAAVVVATDDIVRRRRVPLFSMLYPAFLMLFWLLARQPPASILPYVGNRLTISMNYTSAMAINGPWSEVVAYCVLALGLLWIAGRMWTDRGWRGAVLPTAALAGYLFVVFKEGFVRHDEHAVIATSVLFFVSITVARKLQSCAVTPRVRLLPYALFVLAGSLLWWSMRLHTQEGLIRFIAWTTGTLDDRAAAFGRFVSDPRRMDQEFVDHLARIRDELPLPALGDGTVDIYPYGQTQLVANSLNYSPRPVIQSYMTYNTALARINSEHLRGPRAPDHIFFQVYPIDQRYPSLDDCLSWLEILDRYTIVQETNDMLWLKRRQQPRGLKLDRVQERAIHFDEQIQLPQPEGGLIWSQIDIKQTLQGRMATFLFKVPWVYLTGRTTDGTTHQFTLVPGLCRGGFLLSPIVIDHHDFASLFETTTGEQPRGTALEWFTLSTFGGPGLIYHADIQVAFLRIARAKDPP